jgi:8-oxo-dGTP pyrophosphatase MutT (NUDIX family)
LSPGPVARAATVILMRDRDGAAPELLMIRRSAALAFAAGAWVFPGGRVDPADEALAAASLAQDLSPEDGAARIAAIRETIEEAGVAIGLTPLPAAPTMAALRAGLHAGVAFGILLERYGLTLTPEALHPFCRWLPPESAPRRFDTRFYLARAPNDAAINVDGGETVAAGWFTAEAMLARSDTRLLFPTVCNLHRLAPYPDFASAARDAAAAPPDPITTQIVQAGGVTFLQMPEGLGYPMTRLCMADAFRD